MRYKNFLLNSALVVASIAISYLVLEIGYRVYSFKHIHEQVTDRLVQAVHDSTSNDSRWTYDPVVGYRYTPNKTWEFNSKELQARYSVNEHGLVADDIDSSPYPVKKPSDEYRIALVGDSMVAGVDNYLRMSDLVQDYLNRSEVWRAFVGGKFTRVINFGMDGTGLVQWGPSYRSEARQFSPDLVIVNFILDDVMRRFVSRGSNPQLGADELRPYIAQRVTASMWRGMPWFEWYPELLANTAVGRLLGMQPRLVASEAMNGDSQTKFQSQDEGIRVSLAALERIRCLSPRLLLFNQPMYEELTVPADGPRRWPPLLRYLSGKFIKAAAADGFSIVNLAKVYPSPKDNLQVSALFNLPVDTHYSDYGTFVYASWLTSYLLDWSGTPAARAPLTPVSCQ
jgi:hypothetical protein